MIPTDQFGPSEHADIVRATASDQANRCRRLARSINDRDTARLLEDMADEYERRGAATG